MEVSVYGLDAVSGDGFQDSQAFEPFVLRAHDLWDARSLHFASKHARKIEESFDRGLACARYPGDAPAGNGRTTYAEKICELSFIDAERFFDLIEHRVGGPI